MKVYFKTLGCEKNTVDTEFAQGTLIKAGHSVTDNPEEADVLIVNTCGFIEDAKVQSIDAILELVNSKSEKQKLYVSGCMAQRYGNELQKEIPEVDGFLGVNNYAKLPELIGSSWNQPVTDDCKTEYEEFPDRLMDGREQPWTASLKIAEGCDNHCTYCAIPFMRGKYRSRKPENIIDEAKKLVESGASEIVVIAQDVTYYGKDFGRDDMLPQLLHDLCGIEGLKWLRVMYCYEDEITDGLIEAIKTEPKICKYIDIPLQHGNDSILKLMNRKSTQNTIKSTINKLRKEIPDIIIRTTLITGFPGEKQAEFKDLYNFVKEMEFDRLGVFAYSKEDGTAAARMKPQVRQDVKERRRDRIMELQREISLKHNLAFVGKTLEVLVEEDCNDGTFIGRTSMDAPEIDNGVIFTSDKKHKPGEFVMVKINDAFDYDLSGTAL